MDETVARIHRFLDEQRQHQIITPNSEMLREAAKNREFRDVLSRSSLNLPDGAGLLLMARLTGQRLPYRVTGTDTLQILCRDLGPEYPVFFLGAGPGVAERAAQELKARNPRLKIVGTYAGSPSESDAADIVARINAANPVLLFVAFGAPRQEMWIAQHLSSLTSVKVAMGIGGAFDFIAGVQKRAPALFRSVGLEWLWRVVREPKRIGRIWNAVVVFPSLVARYGREAP